MYGYCQQLEMPTTPGIKWVKENTSGIFRKKIMSSNHSFSCQQWLEWRQETDSFLLNKSGKRSHIQMQYFRGEVKLFNSKTQDFSWPVDGYAESDQGSKIYEFLGDRYHAGCPRCNPDEFDETWERKKSDMKKMGYEIEYIWECEWLQMKRLVTEIPTPRFPNILKPTGNESEILNGIKEGHLFGFLLCDLYSPEHVIEKWQNFPLVVKRETITESYLSEEMRNQVQKEYGDLKSFKRTTLIQCFNDENHLLFSPLAIFYMEEGLEIKNIKMFIQYRPDTCLKPFIDTVTKMRVEAEYENKPLKGSTAKIFGNSGYGAVV